MRDFLIVVFWLLGAFLFFVCGSLVGNWREVFARNETKRDVACTFAAGAGFLSLAAIGNAYSSIWLNLTLLLGVPFCAWFVYSGYITNFQEKEARAEEARALAQRRADLQEETKKASPNAEEFYSKIIDGLHIPAYLQEPLRNCLTQIHFSEIETFLQNPKVIETLPAVFSKITPGERTEVIVQTLRRVIDGLYKPELENGPFGITLLDALPEPKEAVRWLAWSGWYDKHSNLYDGFAFGTLARVMKSNLLEASKTLSTKALEAGERIYAQDSDGSPRETAQTYLQLTPFIDLLLAATPFGFPEESRFRHQWVVGDTGSGKTTFLSTMIAHDLARVARGECSIFVMDSQNELIPEIARLSEFARGGPLFGKLIYLEPDPDYPLALNIFDVHRRRIESLSKADQMMLERGAQWMVEFFLKSLVKAEASPHQDTFLKFIIPAVMAIPDATIFTLKELLDPPAPKGTPPGYEKYKQHFAHLRPDTQRWLAERMHSSELAPTRNAIRARLDGFTADSFFHDMFVSPRNRLDLFSELQESKVILVNTKKGLLRSGTEAFGRFFIAQLVQAMEERMLIGRGERLPVFAYIDEASDYIAEEENVEELVDKARKQRMGFIFANQRESQITSLTVRDALSRAAIQCRGQSQGSGVSPLWQVSMNGKQPLEVQVPNTQFKTMLTMDDAEFVRLMDDMHTRYCGGHESQPVATPASSNKEPDPVLRKLYAELSRPASGDSDDPTSWR